MSQLSSELEQQLLNEYWAGLLIPTESWEGSQFLLSVVGPIGSGKSTVLAQFSEVLGLLRISSDGMRAVLKAHDLGYEHLKSLMRATYTHFLDQGYSIAMDMNCGNPETKENILEVEQRYQIKSHWLVIDLPETVIKKRLQGGRGTIHESFESAWQNYQAQVALEDRFHPLYKPFGVITEATTESDMKSLIVDLKNRLKS